MVSVRLAPVVMFGRVRKSSIFRSPLKNSTPVILFFMRCIPPSILAVLFVTGVWNLPISAASMVKPTMVEPLQAARAACNPDRFAFTCSSECVSGVCEWVGGWVGDLLNTAFCKCACNRFLAVKRSFLFLAIITANSNSEHTSHFLNPTARRFLFFTEYNSPLAGSGIWALSPLYQILRKVLCCTQKLFCKCATYALNTSGTDWRSSQRILSTGDFSLCINTCDATYCAATACFCSAARSPTLYFGSSRTPSRTMDSYLAKRTLFVTIPSMMQKASLHTGTGPMW